MATVNTAASKTVTKPWFWKSRNFLVGAAITALVAGGGVTYALWPTNYEQRAVELAKKDPNELRKAVESGQIPREVAWEAFGAAREAEMQKQMNSFFALKTPLDRNKFLDKMIDEQQARMREWQQRATTRPARPEGERRREDRGPTSQPSEARRKEMEQRRNARADSTPPQERAQRVEFMMAMRKRMQERGITAPGGGGMRGFGGGGPGGPGGGRGGGPR